MSGTYPPLNYHGRRLLRQLRELRLQAGLTQTQAGDQAHLALQKLSRIETAQLPSYHELVILLPAYGVSDTDAAPYIELWEQAKEKPWWRALGPHESCYVAAEDEASTMFEFHLGHLPDLTQTEDYARRLHRRLMSSRERDLEARLAILLRRQERLYMVNERRLDVHAIVFEPVLRHGCDRAQLLQLIVWAKLPTVSLQVLPLSADFHPGLVGSMVLFGFPDVDEPEQAFTSDITCGFRPVKQGDIFTVSQALKELEGVALNTRKTLQLLRNLAQES